MLLWLGAALLCLVLLPLAAWGYILAADRQTERNTRVIGAALEAFAREHGAFPDDIQALTEQGYLAAFPINPYAFRPMHHLPLKPELASGQYVYVVPSGGDFTYVHFPLTVSDPPDKDSFTLLSYYKIGRGLTRLTKDSGWWVQIDWTYVCMECRGSLHTSGKTSIDYLSTTDSMREFFQTARDR